MHFKLISWIDSRYLLDGNDYSGSWSDVEYPEGPSSDSNLSSGFECFAGPGFVLGLPWYGLEVADCVVLVQEEGAYKYNVDFLRYVMTIDEFRSSQILELGWGSEQEFMLWAIEENFREGFKYMCRGGVDLTVLDSNQMGFSHHIFVHSRFEMLDIYLRHEGPFGDVDSDGVCALDYCRSVLCLDELISFLKQEGVNDDYRASIRDCFSLGSIPPIVRWCKLGLEKQSLAVFSNLEVLGVPEEAVSYKGVHALYFLTMMCGLTEPIERALCRLKASYAGVDVPGWLTFVLSNTSSRCDALLLEASEVLELLTHTESLSVPELLEPVSGDMACVNALIHSMQDFNATYFRDTVTPFSSFERFLSDRDLSHPYGDVSTTFSAGSFFSFSDSAWSVPFVIPNKLPQLLPSDSRARLLSLVSDFARSIGYEGVIFLLGYSKSAKLYIKKGYMIMESPHCFFNHHGMLSHLLYFSAFCESEHGQSFARDHSLSKAELGTLLIENKVKSGLLLWDFFADLYANSPASPFWLWSCMVGGMWAKDMPKLTELSRLLCLDSWAEAYAQRPPGYANFSFTYFVMFGGLQRDTAYTGSLSKSDRPSDKWAYPREKGSYLLTNEGFRRLEECELE